MSGFFDKLSSALKSGQSSPVQGEKAFAEAIRQGSRIDLTTIELAPNKPPQSMFTEAVAIDGGLVIIDRPSAGARQPQLYTGQMLSFRFAVGRTIYTGRTKVAGRHRGEAGGRPSFYGYRLVMPSSIEVAAERGTHRVDVRFDLAPSVELHVADSDRPALNGVVDDLSSTGALVKVSGDCLDRLRQGSKVTAKIKMPDPYADLIEAATVVRLSPGKPTIVGLRFLMESEAAAEIVHAIGIRKAKRRR